MISWQRHENCAASQYSKDVPITAKSSKSGYATPDNMVIAQFHECMLKRRDGVMQLQSIVPAETSEPMRRSGSGMVGHQSGPSAADTTLEFGSFRILTRRRQLLADGVPVELGTRAFDLLMVLVDATARLSQRTNSWPSFGREFLWTRPVSRFRSARCARLSARIASLSGPNSAAGIV